MMSDSRRWAEAQRDHYQEPDLRDSLVLLTRVKNGRTSHNAICYVKLINLPRDLAHRVLMPSFGPLAVEGLFDGMHDVAKQLTLKWARAGLDGPLCATDDFTRLTLDSESNYVSVAVRAKYIVQRLPSVPWVTVLTHSTVKTNIHSSEP